MKKLIEPFSMFDTSPLMQIVSKASRARAHHLETMAAAFLKETNIPVKHVELVEQHSGDFIRFYYRDRRKP